MSAEYLNLVETVLTKGKEKTDAQKVGNISYPGPQMRFDLSEGYFPLITVRDLRKSWKAIVGELLWFISGSTDVADLHKHGIKIWDQWADAIEKEMGFPKGELGPIYGKQWRRFEGVGGKTADQLTEAMNLLGTNPDSRRIIVSSWNPTELDKQWIAPCHCFFQFHHAQNELSLILYQRSGDVPVGIPFNIAEYALLLLMAAEVNGMKPKYLVHDIGDAHIYKDQIPHAQELLRREPKTSPRVEFRRKGLASIYDYTHDDFLLLDYDPHPKVSIPVAL